MSHVQKMRRPGQGCYPWHGAEKFRRRDAARFSPSNRRAQGNSRAEAGPTATLAEFPTLSEGAVSVARPSPARHHGPA